MLRDQSASSLSRHILPSLPVGVRRSAGRDIASETPPRGARRRIWRTGTKHQSTESRDGKGRSENRGRQAEKESDGQNTPKLIGRDNHVPKPAGTRPARANCSAADQVADSEDPHGIGGPVLSQLSAAGAVETARISSTASDLRSRSRLLRPLPTRDSVDL